MYFRPSYSELEIALKEAYKSFQICIEKVISLFVIHGLLEFNLNNLKADYLETGRPGDAQHRK